MLRSDAQWDGTQRTPLDRRLAALAGRQHGVVSIAQLRNLGLSPSGVRSRAARGRLHRLHRGVFAVGHEVLTGEGRCMAAVLACGPGAALSHRSAAAHWGIRRTAREAVEVSVPGQVRSRAGIDVHRSATLEPAHVLAIRGIPTTTVPRTLLDLADVVSIHQLRRAIDQAEVLGLLDLRALTELLAGARGRRGARVLRTALSEARDGPRLTRSELEERFLRLVRAAGLPTPSVNAIIQAGADHFEVDFLWPMARLIVEADGQRTHRTRLAFERDRTRDRLLTEAGWRVVRVTWRQVTEDSAALARSLRGLLSIDRRELRSP